MISKVEVNFEDPISLIEQTLAEKIKYRDFYNSIKKDLLKQNENYITNKGCPTKIDPLDLKNYTKNQEEAQKRKTTLIGLYSPKSEKKPYKQLENLRVKNKLLACPMCGELGRPRTLDHHLPKDTYPELAINLFNLIPCCDWCQGEKLTSYKDSLGYRYYLHPYFDDLNKPLFKLIFSGNYSNPKVEIKILDFPDKHFSNTLENHLHGIGFLKRFMEIFPPMWINILRMAQETRIDEGISLKTIYENALKIHNQKSINSWDSILYRSILEDVNLMDYLVNSELPDNI